MIFEEFFSFRSATPGGAMRRAWSSPRLPKVDDRIRASAAKILPFKLTPGQRQALKEIVEDMLRPQPMHRLLQGDVGAGRRLSPCSRRSSRWKTACRSRSWRRPKSWRLSTSATSRGCCRNHAFASTSLTGSTPGLKKHTLHAHIERGTTNLIVGTHALVQEIDQVPQAGTGRDRRAAPVRRGAACGAAGERV